MNAYEFRYGCMRADWLVRHAGLRDLPTALEGHRLYSIGRVLAETRLG